jgi:hypothetical protein
MSVRWIFSAMRRIAEGKDISLAPLEDDLSLHENRLRLAGLCDLVVRLEDDLGVDPFSEAEDAPFPSTVGELVRAYENVIM